MASARPLPSLPRARFGSMPPRSPCEYRRCREHVVVDGIVPNELATARAKSITGATGFSTEAQLFQSSNHDRGEPTSLGETVRVASAEAAGPPRKNVRAVAERADSP